MRTVKIIETLTDLSIIGWMCHDVYITTDNKVFNIYSMARMKERLVNSCYGFTVNGTFHTKKWIRDNCVDVLGCVSE